MPQSQALLQDYVAAVRTANPGSDWEVRAVHLCEGVCPPEASVFAAELYRLWAATPQPRVELIVDNPSAPTHHFLLVEKFKEFEPYFIDDDNTNPHVRRLIKAKNTRGFASILVSALVLGESLLTRIGVNQNQEFFIYDVDHSLCRFWKDNFGTGCSFDFTQNDLENLPYIHNYSPLQWLNVYYLGCPPDIPILYRRCCLFDLAKDKTFLQEKYQTMLNIFLTPLSVINAIADSIFKDQELKQFVISLIKNRLLMLEQQALLIPEFREFIFDKDTENLNVFFKQLEKFPAVDRQRAQMEIKMKFNAVKSERALEYYVLGEPDFSLAYKKTFLKAVMRDRVYAAHRLQDVIEVVNVLRTAPQYQIIKKRSKYFGLSFLGYRDAGVEVSETFIDLIRDAKYHMIEIAKNNAKAGDIEDLKTLATRGNPYNDLINSQRYRFSTVQTAAAYCVELWLKRFQKPVIEMTASSSLRRR